MVGLRNGQSRTIRVEPKDGYGQFETAKINISEEFPMYRTIPKNDFMLTYSEEAVVNKVVVEPYWYWKVQVVAINGDNVTVVSLPEVNQTSKPYGWDTKVLDVNGTLNGGLGRIQVRHYPTTGINVTFGTFKADITSLTATQVELTYNVNSGNALATQALIFQFTVTST
jgi:FKBP-type peptidyl-prolyl cis-trans isomerase 2